MAIDIKKVKAEAIKEHEAEKEVKAKARLKLKLKECEQAKKVVKNIEREIEDLEDELSQE